MRRRKKSSHNISIRVIFTAHTGIGNLAWNDLKIRVRRHLLNIANQSRRSAARDGNDVPGSWNSEWIDSNEFSGRGRTSLRGTTVLGERSSLRANGGYLPVAR